MLFQQQVEKNKSFMKKLFANLQNRAKLQLGPIFLLFMFYSLTTPMFCIPCVSLLLCFIVLACFATPMCFIVFSNLFHLKLSTKYLFAPCYFAKTYALLFLCFIVPCVSPCLDRYYHLFF